MIVDQKFYRFGRQSPRKKRDENTWLIIYLDVFTLMLSVFVILLGYKMHSEQSYKQLTQALFESAFQQQQLAVNAEQKYKAIQRELDEKKDNDAVENVHDKVKDERQNREQIKLELQQLIQKYDLFGSINLRETETAVKLEIDEKILFKLGVADLTENGEDVLAKLFPILKTRQGNIFIEGHTDSLPIATQQFPSNWELSTQRATTVLRFLIAEGIQATRLRAIGFADTQPVAKNDTAQGRAKNRRVSIVIQNSLER